MDKTENIRSMKAELELLKKERAALEETMPVEKRENTIEFVSKKIDALENRIAEAEKSPH